MSYIYKKYILEIYELENNQNNQYVKHIKHIKYIKGGSMEFKKFVNCLRIIEEYEMCKNWRMKDVMSYFGEYVSELQAKAIVIRVEVFIGVPANFTHLMIEFRNCLEHELDIDTPFSLGYRRAKDD